MSFDEFPGVYWIKRFDWQQALGNLVNIVAATSFVVSVVVFAGDANDAPSLTISFIALALFAGILYWVYRYARRERYANVMRLLEGISDQCRTSRQRLLDSKDPTAPNSQLKRDLSVILTDVAMLFSMVTGTQCRAAVKLLGDIDEDEDGNPDEPWVFTLARDRASAGTYKLSDEAREYAKFDKISMNPHLAELFGWKDGEDFQCYNDLRRLIRDGGYTSTTIVWALTESESAASRPERRPLPYASAMIALVQAQDDSHIGFIGVDSDKARAFRDNWDGPLLVAVANMIGALLQDIPFAGGDADQKPVAVVPGGQACLKTQDMVEAGRMGTETMSDAKTAKGKSASSGRFAVSGSKSAKGGSIMSFERNGVRKDVKVRYYSPSLAYYSDKRKKSGE